MKLSIALSALLITGFVATSAEQASAVVYISRRVRRKAGRRTAAAAGRASRGAPRGRCPWCWSTAWNTDESWRSG